MTIATGKHLFPFRTQKLSPSAPMVLPWRRGGRVGHRRVSFFCARSLIVVGPGCLSSAGIGELLSPRQSGGHRGVAGPAVLLAV